jgi:hypothetical protein
MVYVVMKILVDRLPARTVTYRCYKHFNEDMYAEDISRIPASICEVFDDPSDNYWMLQTMIKEIMDEHAPTKTMKVRAKETPFMNGDLRRSVRMKTRLHNIYRKHPTKQNWELYKQQRNITTNIRRDAIRNYFNSKCSDGPRNCNFWKTMKPFLTNKGFKDGSSIMIKTEDTIETKPKEVANLMNNFYVNIASEIGGNINLHQCDASNRDFVSKCEKHFEDHSSIRNIENNMEKCEFTFRHTSASTVEKIVKNLDSKKATGCDGIPAKLLKPVASTISHHISTIFNRCVDTCTFPMDAKLAEVIPLYKKADNLIMKNYRPVSILPSMSKILEKVIHEQLLPFLEKILDPRMAAYRKMYSCQHVLLRLVEDWKQALENNKYVAAMLMDLSKAFDCLPHQLIIAKLKTYGMKEEGCAFIWSYLSKRRQRVKLSGCVSEWLEMLKGVPQGSILGPILFNIFMNDIYASITQASLYNYADDNTLSAVGTTKQEVIECLSQESLVAVDWFHDNMMEANPTKFQAIVLRDSGDTTNIPIGDSNITSEKQVQLLGVTIDEKLNFHQQVNTLCRKAGAQLRVLQRLSGYLDQPSRLSIFRCFVLSHFNYCSLVWNFCGAVHTARMERIQYRALKFVYNDFDSSYDKLLTRAKLPTLELSRKRAILVEVYKAVNKLSPSFMWDLFHVKDVKYNLRNCNSLCVKQCRTKKYGQDSLSNYGAKMWNSLPHELKMCKDLGTFRESVKNWSEPLCKCRMCV